MVCLLSLRYTYTQIPIVLYNKVWIIIQLMMRSMMNITLITGYPLTMLFEAELTPKMLRFFYKLNYMYLFVAN